MPNPKPTFDKIHNMMITEAIDEVLKDLRYAVNDYNTKFGSEMLGNAIKKLKALREIHASELPKRTTIEPVGDGGYVLTETYDA